MRCRVERAQHGSWQLGRAQVSHSLDKHHAHTCLGPKKRMRQRPLPLVVMTTPKSHPNQPSPLFLLRSPKSRDPRPPQRSFLLLLLSHPCSASKAFFGFLGASPVAKRQQSVPFLLQESCTALWQGRRPWANSR